MVLLAAPNTKNRIAEIFRELVPLSNGAWPGMPRGCSAIV